jgi:hypothetical protein
MEGVRHNLEVEVVGFPILNIYYTIETQTRCNKYKTSRWESLFHEKNYIGCQRPLINLNLTTIVAEIHHKHGEATKPKNYKLQNMNK